MILRDNRMTCKERILSEDYADIIINFIPTENLVQEINADYCYQSIDNDLGLVYVVRNDIQDIKESSENVFPYQTIPKCYGLMDIGTSVASPFDPNSLIDSGIISVQNPPLELTGKGVVMCFIDTGINYENPVFLRNDGSSRVLAIWDQTIQSGNPPEGFLYGTEYTREKINAALLSNNPKSIVPSTDEIGHGSAIASVAAGSKLEEGRVFTGAAPDCDIVVVKLKQAKKYIREYNFIPDGVACYSEADIIMALKYVSSFAISFVRPIVICFGLGSNFGDHAGKSLLSKYLNRIAQRRNIGVVICGGNEGNSSNHYSNVLTTDPDGSIDNVEVKVAESEPGFLMEIWGSAPAIFTVSIRSPGGESIPRIVYRASSKSITYRFIFEKTILTVDYVIVEQTSGEELVILRFENPTPGIWTIQMRNETNYIRSVFHMWLPISQFLYQDTFFISSNPYVTLTEPGNAEDVITTSTFDDRNNSFYINSGRGFTRRSELKPDIAAPGVEVSTVYGKRSGSSIGAAITAGGLAQILQWAVIDNNDPLIDNTDMKSYLIRGATREKFLEYPNREWGFGRLNIQGIFNALARKTR